MTLDEIKAAVDAGNGVHWKNYAYRVIKDSLGQYLILCVMNEDCVGLTHRDGVTLNGQPEDFFFVAILPTTFDTTTSDFPGHLAPPFGVQP